MNTSAVATNVSVQQTEQKKAKDKNKKDVYTQTPLRKLGFLDEYGEALRPILSASKSGIIRGIPNFAYLPATLYMLSDVQDKYKKGKEEHDTKYAAKLAAREAVYQGIVSVAAPMAIVRGIHKLTKTAVNKLPILSKAADALQKTAANAAGKNSGLKNVLSKAGMPAKIAGAAISILAVSKLTKPIDFITSKIFKNVVDPALKINED